MEKSFDRLVNELSQSSEVLPEIIEYLREQTNDRLSSFASQSLSSLIQLEHWTWDVFTEESHSWTNQPNYMQLFRLLGSLNYQIIFQKKDLDADAKSSLLIPPTTDILQKVFDQIELIEDENDRYFVIISRWFDNLAFFIHEYTQFEISPVFIYLGQHIGRHYLLSSQYKFYLTELAQSQIPQSIFTAKQLFYIKTCSFFFRMFICSNVDKQPFRAEDFLTKYGNDYLEIILVHHHTVQSWNKELFICIAHLIDLTCAFCWWGNDRAVYMEILVSSEQLFYDYIRALIVIIGYRPFHERISSQWCNDQTILIDSTCIFLIGALFQMKNLACFLRSETKLSKIILEIAQISSYDRISICAYGILAEILSDQQLREVKITENISEFFFQTLESAWKHPTQCYKRLPIAQLLTGFLTLSKNDAIQEKTVRSNKLPLLIEMSDQYPITLSILWSLSFNPQIQKELRANRTFMSKLTCLKEEAKDAKMRKIIFGILWNLEEKRLDRVVSEPTMFDIMISYSHKDEAICKPIYEELVKAGYRVWIDFDQIHGNVMDAMAQAIEQSETILICMSEQYRRSNYCRAEAHYAFQRQLRIVPILLQEHYQPDGWLLFLIGQLLYVDFTKYEFPRAMEKLIEELRSSMTGNSNTPTSGPQDEPHFPIVPAMELVILPRNMLDWTHSHVQNWLKGLNLRQMARLLVEFDGRSLNSLGEFLADSNPHQILTFFQEDSHRKLHENISLLELARFRTLLQQRQRLPPEHSLPIFNFLSQCRVSECQIL